MKLLDPKDKKRYEKELKILTRASDFEAAHCKADDILCEILNKMGYRAIAKIFNDVPTK